MRWIVRIDVKDWRIPAAYVLGLFSASPTIVVFVDENYFECSSPVYRLHGFLLPFWVNV